MKLRSFALSILLAMILLCVAMPVQAALAEANPVLLLSGKMEGEEIVVTATLRNNEGISAMLLNLEFDREKLILKDCKQEEALSSLDLLSSANYDVYPYVLTWSGDDNDATNGKLLTMRFAVVENASGQASVKFTYTRDRDINYYQGGDVKTRNLMADTLHIELASGEATAFDTESEVESTISEEKESKTGLIVGLAVGGTVGIVAIVLIPWLVVRKKRV